MLDHRPPPASTIRAAAAPACAVVLHALAALLLWAVPPRAATAPAATEPVVEVVVDSLEERGAPSPPAAAEEPDRTTGAVASRSEQPARPSTQTERSATVGRPSSAEEPTQPAPDHPGEPPGRPGLSGDGADAPGPVQLTVRRPEDIGIGGPNRFLPKSQAAVEDAESRRAIDRAMKDPARAREEELGLGPGGPVITALAESTARSLAPVRGRAVFVATANAAGEVVSIEVTTTDGSRAGWVDAAQGALAGLKGKKLRLASNVSRAVMRIEVTSAWKMPSGQDPGTDITLFHIPISKGEGKDSPKMTILDPIPKFHVDYLEVGGPNGAKIPLPSIELDLFSTNADPTNIGAKPRRVVHAHVLDTQLM
jgi:hypothetical protein